MGAGTLVIAIVATPLLVFGERAARATAKFWTRSMLSGLKWICGVDCRIKGRDRIPTGAAIIAANHQSMWETIALYVLAPDPVIVFKKELLRVPIYGWWAKAAGCIPVDREAGAKAIRALSAAAKEKLAAGKQVILFPGGTRSRLGEKSELQPGVAAVYMIGEAPVTPAVHDSGRCWTYPGGVSSLKLPGVITLEFLPAIEPGLPRKTFMAELSTRLGAAEARLAGAQKTADEPGAAVRREEGAIA